MNGKWKLTTDQIADIKRLYAEGHSGYALEVRFNVSHQAIYYHTKGVEKKIQEIKKVKTYLDYLEESRRRE